MASIDELGGRHLIIGGGNLGIDLHLALTNAGYEADIYTAKSGFGYPKNTVRELPLELAKWVWVTVGAGSVGEAKKSFLPFIDLHLRLIADLRENLTPDVNLVCFSSDYAVGEPQSLYALSKKMMEDYVNKLPLKNTWVVRVGSLYGTHKPDTCFPSKIRRNFESNPLPITLPSNKVQPTPTAWVAQTLVKSFAVIDRLKSVFNKNLNMSPCDNITLSQWANLAIPEGKFIEGNLDIERPTASLIGNDFILPTPGCAELWRKYGKDFNW